MLARSRSLVLVFVVSGGMLATVLLAWGLEQRGDVGLSAAGSPAARSVPASVPARVSRLLPGARPVSDRSSRFSSTYAGRDGSMVTRVSASPLNFRDRNGQWRAIDSRLVTRGDGFVNRAGTHVVSLPRQLSTGVGVRSGTDSLSMRLVGAAASVSVRGARASYPNALPGVTVLYDSQPQGLREQLVIADRSAPRRFVFELSGGTGLQARVDRRGAVSFSRHGRVVFFLPPSVAFPQGHQSDLHPVRSVLRRTAGGGR
jgi:hypothetical protein